MCRKAEEKGVLDDKNAKREVIPIARQVVREMVRRGQIKAHWTSFLAPAGVRRSGG